MIITNMSEREEPDDFDFDIAFDNGHDIDSFLEGPRQNQYIEVILSVDELKKYKKAAQHDEEVNVLTLSKAGGRYYIRGAKNPERKVPRGKVWVAVASVDQKSLSSFYKRLENQNDS